MGEHSISWKPLRFVLWFPSLISCSPNLLRVYIRLCKHGNHFTFHHYKITMLCWTEWQVLGIVVVDWTWQLNNNFCVMHDKGFFFLFSKQCFNPLHPKIRSHILQIVLCSFPNVLTGRICLNIKLPLQWWLFPVFFWP